MRARLLSQTIDLLLTRYPLRAVTPKHPSALDSPEGLSPVFAADSGRQRQWKAFVRDLGTGAPELDEAVAELARFLLPHALRANEGV